MNSNAASILSLARSTASVFTLQGNKCVGSPNGSAPLPQNECQYAQAKRKWSFMVLPATTLFSSYQRNASGLSDCVPSYFTWPMPLKYSFSPVVIIMLNY